jgi:hypothetical protein
LKIILLTCLLLLTACSLDSPEPLETVPDAPPVTAAPSETVLSPGPDHLTPIPFQTPAASVPQDEPGLVETQTVQETAQGTVPDPFPAETPSIDLPRTQYKISASLNYYARNVQAQAFIEYPNSSQDILDEILLIVDANRYWGAFELKYIMWEDGSPASTFSLENDRLTIPLPEPLNPNEILSLEIVYDLHIPQIPPPSDIYKPQPFGYTERQLNLVDWYPFVPPYQVGKGWVANQPWFFGEHQVYDKADFMVEIDTVNSAEDLTLAASSLPEQQGTRYIYNHTNARTFALSASHMYEVLYENAGEVLVISYFFPYDSTAGGAVLQDTAAAISLYSDLFGQYPHEAISVVEADFLDGMEYDGLFFLSRGFYNIYDGTPMSYLTAIAVHEAAHQWWYGVVGNDQAHEPWLDEALCTYSELLFYEYIYPDALPWWWTYRVYYYEPSGRIDGSIYDYPGFRPYRDAVYLNGAVFLHELRQEIGDEAFFSFLKAYAARNAVNLATKQAFFTILADFTDSDISAITNRFFQSFSQE